MRSQILSKLAGVVALCLAMGATASAQYGGGGMGGGGTGGGTGGTGGSSVGGTGTGSSHSSGSGAAVGIAVGVGAAAAVGIALLVHHHHKASSQAQALLIGCTQSQPNGISLKSEEDGQSYVLVSTGKHIEAGERVELKGFVKNDRSAGYAFRVRDVVTDFGACSQSQVASTQNPNGKVLASVAE